MTGSLVDIEQILELYNQILKEHLVKYDLEKVTLVEVADFCAEYCESEATKRYSHEVKVSAIGGVIVFTDMWLKSVNKPH